MAVMDTQCTSPDLGAMDLNAGLKNSCHVALGGVLFDFNESTLQPASDPVLQKSRRSSFERSGLEGGSPGTYG
jgi:hypothetical protein